MSHPSIERYLLSGQILADRLESNDAFQLEQWRQIREHLDHCEECRRLYQMWLRVHHLLDEAFLVDPSPGFTARWQERLNQERLYNEKMQFWSVFSLSAGGMLMVLIMLTYLLGLAFETPSELLTMLNLRIRDLVICFYALMTLIKSLVSLIPIPVQLSLIVGMFSSFMAAAVWWLVSMQRIYFSKSSYGA